VCQTEAGAPTTSARGWVWGQGELVGRHRGRRQLCCRLGAVEMERKVQEELVRFKEEGNAGEEALPTRTWAIYPQPIPFPTEHPTPLPCLYHGAVPAARYSPCVPPCAPWAWRMRATRLQRVAFLLLPAGQWATSPFSPLPGSKRKSIGLHP